MYQLINGDISFAKLKVVEIEDLLCRQIASHNPKQIIVVDIYENNAYDIQQELKRTYPSLNLVVLISTDKAVNPTNIMGASNLFVDCSRCLCKRRRNFRTGYGGTG